MHALIFRAGNQASLERHKESSFYLSSQDLDTQMTSGSELQLQASDLVPKRQSSAPGALDTDYAAHILEHARILDSWALGRDTSSQADDTILPEVGKLIPVLAGDPMAILGREQADRSEIRKQGARIACAAGAYSAREMRF